MQQSPAYVVTVPEQADIASVRALHEACVAVAGEHAFIHMDLSRVSRLTTPGVQVLLATARQAGEGCRFLAPSAECGRVFGDLGLGREMQLRIDNP